MIQNIQLKEEGNEVSGSVRPGDGEEDDEGVGNGEQQIGGK